MILHEVCVLPSQETIAYLQRVLAASSLTFKLDELRLTLNVSTEYPPKIDQAGFYTAQPVDLHVWYDPASQSSQLVLLFHSESLTERALELRHEAPNPFHVNYYPHLVLIEDMPPIQRHFRAQMNSYGDTFLKDRFTFTFEGEFVFSYEAAAGPSLALYDALDMKTGQAIRSTW